MAINQDKHKMLSRPQGGVAAIATFDLVAQTLDQLSNRRVGVDNIGGLYGPSGWGKTFSTNILAVETRAYFVQMQPVWTKKTMLQKILAEMRIEFASSDSIPDLFDMVVNQLAASQRMLIIDEFNRAIEKPILAQITRAIADCAQTPILIVGEEQMRNVLAKKSEFKQLNRRISYWAEAKNVSESDTAKLMPIYCPDIDIDGDALEALTDFAKGSVSSVVKCLNVIHEYCMTHGHEQVSLPILKKIALPSATHPIRRV